MTREVKDAKMTERIVNSIHIYNNIGDLKLIFRRAKLLIFYVVWVLNFAIFS